MKQTLTLGFLATLNVFLGFFYQWYVLLAVGPSLQTDALFASATMSQFVLMVLSGSLTSVLLPLLSSENEETFQQNTWSLLQILGIIFGALAFLLGLSANIWVPLSVPGFNKETLALTISLTKIQLAGVAFTGMSAVASSAHQARSKFLFPEITNLLVGLAGLGLLILLLPLYGVVAAAWVAIFRLSLTFFILLVPDFKHYQSPNWQSPLIKEALKRLKPLLVGAIFYKSVVFADRFLASLAPMGSLSLLTFAQQIYGAMELIIGKAVVTPMVPLLIKNLKNKNWNGFTQTYKKRIFGISGITTISFLSLLITGLPIISRLVGFGSFQQNNVRLLWLILIVLSGQLLFSPILNVLMTVFYSLGNTTTPAWIRSIATMIGIIVRALGFFLGGLLGLGFGMSCFYIIMLMLIIPPFKNFIKKSKKTPYFHDFSDLGYEKTA